MRKSSIQFQIFNNAKRQSPSLIDIDELADAIRTGGANGAEKLNTQWARETLAAGGEDEYQSRKGDIFRTISVGGVYDGSGVYRMDNITSLTGFLMVDIDGVVDENYAAAIRDGIFNDSQLRPVLAFVSPSGHGVKLLFRMRNLEGGGTKEEMQQRYNNEFRRICAAIVSVRSGMFDKNDPHTPPVEMDASSADMTRCCFIAHDPQCKYDDTLPYSAVDELLFPDDCGAYRAAMRTLGWDGAAVETTNNLKTYDSGLIVPNLTVGSDYDSAAHKGILDDIKSKLVIGNDGNYVYNMQKRLFIGHRHLNNNKVTIDGHSGYDLMFMLNTVAMWLYDNDIQKSETFLGGVFDEYENDRTWTRVSGTHGKTLPNVKLVRWLLGKLSFDGYSNGVTTTMQYDFGEDDDLSMYGNLTSTRRYFADDPNFCTDNNLIPILASCFDGGGQNQWKDLRFYSMLTTLSGFAPNQIVNVLEGKRKGLNLQLIVVGAQGTGKGQMSFARDNILKSLDYFCQYLTGKEQYRVERERREGGTTMEVEGDEYANEEDYIGRKALVFVNDVKKPTYASLMRLLPPNRAKLMLYQEELSVWENLDGGFGATKDVIKLIYDNAKIANENSEAIEKGNTIQVFDPNAAVLASGTPDQFRSFFKTVENGELRRGVIFLVEKGEYIPFRCRGSKTDYRDIERFFLQWYFYNFYSENVKCYIPSEENENQMIAFWKKYVDDKLSKYGGYTTIEEANEGFIKSVQVYEYRLAALLQSLHDFYHSGHWDRLLDLDDFNRTHRIMVWDDMCHQYVERTADDYITLVRSSMTPYERTTVDVELRMEFIALAHRIFNARLSDTTRMIEAHDKRNLLSGTSNPLFEKYRVCLCNVNDMFTRAEYEKEYKKLNPTVTARYITTRLNVLVDEGVITRIKRGTYKKNKKIK